MKTRLFTLLFFFIINFTYAQIGGRQNFEFMRIPADAKLGSIGGVNVSTGFKDVNAIWRNPALLSDSAHHNASFSYIPWQADIHNFTLSYAHPFKNKASLGFGLYMVNYGKLQETDASGQILGEFKADDFALNLSYAFHQGHFRFGSNLKLLGSQIDVYNAYALAWDLGAIFQHPKKNFSFGLAIKNIGIPLSKYTPEAKTNLPLDVQIGSTFKPEFMPLRFSVTLHHLYQFDIVYLDPNRQVELDINGNAIPEEKTFFDKLARHFVLGAEVLLAKGFQINLGYNHLINREMKIEGVGGLRGISFGFDLQVKAFSFAFGRGTYHIGEGRSFFTLRGDLGRVFKKKKK